MAIRHVFISGVSRGIGEALARSFLAKGWEVFGVSRGAPSIRHSLFTWKRCDVSKPADVKKVFSRMTRRFDCVIGNAATGGPIGRALSIPLRQWREVFDVNFFSHLEVVRRAVGRAKPGAAFIFFSGRGAVSPRPLAGPYALSKLAVTKLAEQLASEYPRFRFYAIAPGAHDTKMAREHLRLLKEPTPEAAGIRPVARLLGRLIRDRKGRLNGRLLHIRDDVERLLSVAEGGYIRRREQR